MPSKVAAFTALATFAGTVTGMKSSFDLPKTPEQVTPDALPCAILVPEVGDEPGFKTLSYLGNSPLEDFVIKQVILYKPSQNTPFRNVLPDMMTLADAYTQTLKATPFLVTLVAGVSPPIHNPAAPKIAYGTIDYGGTEYHGIILTFSMRIYL